MDKFNNHTFAICAYKESRYLEECVKSVINQEVKSNIIICTSTPNDFITTIADKYSLKLFIRNGKPDIQDDWNFAYECAKTEYVTIAHQDDIYESNYAKELKNYISQDKQSIIIFSDYREIKNDDVIPLNINLKIKKIMLTPLKIKLFRKSKFVRNRILSLGSPICCPSVTYNKNMHKDKLFISKMKCSLDWDTWYRFSKYEGSFIYINKELVLHRIHEESETTNCIENNIRQTEDLNMFRKFWPESIAKLLAKFYSKSLNSNKVI